jgi:hypothetical protein
VTHNNNGGVVAAGRVRTGSRHGRCSLGRAIGNDVVLVDVISAPSTIHIQGEQEFWLIISSSRNSTYLNGGRLASPPASRMATSQIGPSL